MKKLKKSHAPRAASKNRKSGLKMKRLAHTKRLVRNHAK